MPVKFKNPNVQDEYSGVDEALRRAIESSPYALTITSGERSPETNAMVGGVPNSKHLSGRAVDIRKSQDSADVANYFKNLGYNVLDEGDHLHTQMNGQFFNKVGSLLSRTSKDDPFLKSMMPDEPSLPRTSRDDPFLREMLSQTPSPQAFSIDSKDVPRETNPLLENMPGLPKFLLAAGSAGTHKIVPGLETAENFVAPKINQLVESLGGKPMDLNAERDYLKEKNPYYGDTIGQLAAQVPQYAAAMIGGEAALPATWPYQLAGGGALSGAVNAAQGAQERFDINKPSLGQDASKSGMDALLGAIFHGVNMGMFRGATPNMVSKAYEGLQKSIPAEAMYNPSPEMMAYLKAAEGSSPEAKALLTKLSPEDLSKAPMKIGGKEVPDSVRKAFMKQQGVAEPDGPAGISLKQALAEKEVAGANESGRVTAGKLKSDIQKSMSPQQQRLYGEALTNAKALANRPQFNLRNISDIGVPAAISLASPKAATLAGFLGSLDLLGRTLPRSAGIRGAATGLMSKQGRSLDDLLSFISDNYQNYKRDN